MKILMVSNCLPRTILLVMILLDEVLEIHRQRANTKKTFEDILQLDEHCKSNLKETNEHMIQMFPTEYKEGKKRKDNEFVRLIKLEDTDITKYIKQKTKGF